MSSVPLLTCLSPSCGFGLEAGLFIAQFDLLLRHCQVTGDAHRVLFAVAFPVAGDPTEPLTAGAHVVYACPSDSTSQAYRSHGSHTRQDLPSALVDIAKPSPLRRGLRRCRLGVRDPYLLCADSAQLSLPPVASWAAVVLVACPAWLPGVGAGTDEDPGEDWRRGLRRSGVDSSDGSV